MFKRKEHVDSSLPDFEAKETVHVAIDFNVGCCMIAHFKSCEFRETPNSNAEGNPEPSLSGGRCNDYPFWEYAQVSGSAGHLIVR